MTHFAVFLPFSGCFCYKNFFNIGRIPDFFVTTIPNSVAHRNIRKKVFLDKKIPKKTRGERSSSFYWDFFASPGYSRSHTHTL